MHMQGSSYVIEPDTHDVHICGSCRSNFTDIGLFILHKRNGCPNPIGSSEADLLRPPECAPVDVATPQSLAAAESRECPVQIPPKISAALRFSPKRNSGATTVISNSFTGDIKARTRNKKFLCTFEGCKYSSSYPKDLQRHLFTHSGERPFPCQICSKSFSRLDKLKTHERQHTGQKPYKCSICSYAAADSSSLKKHNRVHTDERPYRCQMCQYASRNSSQLTVHLRTHTGDAPFKCPCCPSKFKINSDLTRHMRLHTGEKPFACTICDFRCTIKTNLNTHIRINHSTEDLQRCSQCDFSTPSRRLLKQHQKTHLPNVVRCTERLCEFVCSSEAALRKHALVHLEERPYKCQHCCYSSRQPGNVRTHNKKRHPEKGKLKRLKRLGVKSKREKPDGSSGSSDDVPSPSALTQSALSDINAERPGSPSPENDTGVTGVGGSAVTNGRLQPLCVRAFQCQVCDAAFVREDSLRSHVRQHQRAQQQQSRPAAAATVNVAVQAAGDDVTDVNAAVQANDVTTSTSFANPCDLLLAVAAATPDTPSNHGHQSYSQISEYEGESSRLVVRKCHPQPMLPPTSTVLCFQQTQTGVQPMQVGSSVVPTGHEQNQKLSPSDTILLNSGDQPENVATVPTQLLYHVQAYQPTNVLQYMLQPSPSDQHFLLSAAPGDGGGVAATELVYVPGTAESAGTYYQVSSSSMAASAPQLVNYVVANGAALSSEVGGVVMASAPPGGYSFQLVDDCRQQQHQLQSQSAVVLCSSDCHEPHSTVVYTTGSTMQASTVDSTIN